MLVRRFCERKESSVTLVRRFCDKTRSVTSVTETIAVGEQKVGVPVFPKQEGSHVIGLSRRPKNRSQATPIRLYSRLRLYSCSCLYGAGSCGCQRNFQTSTRRHWHQRPNLVRWSLTMPSQFTCVLTDARGFRPQLTALIRAGAVRRTA